MKSELVYTILVPDRSVIVPIPLTSLWLLISVMVAAVLTIVGSVLSPETFRLLSVPRNCREEYMTLFPNVSLDSTSTPLIL